MLKKIVLLISVVVVLIVALVLFRGINADQSASPDDLHEVDLALRMQEGDVFKFCQREEIDLKEAGKGIMAAKRKFWVELDYTIKCLEVLPDGSMKIKQKWDAARAKGTGSGGRIDWDSQAKGKSLAPHDFKRYGMLVGKEIEFQVAPNGEILELWNADVIAEAILLEKGVRPKKAEDEEYEAYLEMMMDQVWESKEHVLDCAWGSYPEKTLLTTEQWWIEAPATTTRPGLQVMKLKFNQVRKGKAHFDVILSAMAGDDSMDGGDFFGSINSKIDSFAQGKMEMDVSTGLIAQATVSGDIRMEAQIEDRLWDVQYEKNMEGKISQSLRQIP